MGVHYFLLEKDPNFRGNQLALEHAHTARMRSAVAKVAYKPIEVVVHVLWNVESENVGEAQIASQIDVLNRDFRKLNPDVGTVPEVWKGLAADIGVQFQLAKKDPSGVATTGITRTKTTATGFGTTDKMKSSATGGIEPWDTSRYLNLWVCTLKDGILGYAQFPGGPSATDGVVILNQAFGTVGTLIPQFNLGRTATHEVGHYLNLRHIWGDDEDCSGSDFVADTPNAETANVGVPTFPHISCSNGPNGDMFMNYMDYSDDAALVMFTEGQAARIHTALAGPRKSLVT